MSNNLSTTAVAPTSTPVAAKNLYPARFYRANISLTQVRSRLDSTGEDFVFYRAALISRPQDSFHIDGTPLDLSQGLAAVTIWGVPVEYSEGALLEGIVLAPRQGEDGFNFVGPLEDPQVQKCLQLAGLDSETLPWAPYPRPVVENRESAIAASREQRRAIAGNTPANASATMASLLA